MNLKYTYNVSSFIYSIPFLMVFVVIHHTRDLLPDALHTTAMVKVTLKDVNDNRPQFYPERYSVIIHRDATLGSTIVVVKATDQDSGAAGLVSYSIVGGNADHFFSIDSATGMVIYLAPGSLLCYMTIDPDIGPLSNSDDMWQLRMQKQIT